MKRLRALARVAKRAVVFTVGALIAVAVVELLEEQEKRP